MPDSRETEQGGLGAFAEIDRERRAARELAAWDAAFAAACPAGHAASPASVADPDGAHTEALTSPAYGEENATVRTRGTARPDDGEAGAASPWPGGEVSEPRGAVRHVTWGNDRLSITAHCGWRELNEAEPRRIEETHADRRRKRG
jgi:hypothetical protein